MTGSRGTQHQKNGFSKKDMDWLFSNLTLSNKEKLSQRAEASANRPNGTESTEAKPSTLSNLQTFHYCFLSPFAHICSYAVAAIDIVWFQTCRP